MATPATKTPNEQIEEMSAELITLREKCKVLDNPDFSKMRKDELGRVTGYFEGTDESVDLRISPTEGRLNKSYRQQGRDNTRLLKSLGYQPHNRFKSFDQFIRFGIENRNNPSKIETAVAEQAKVLLDYEKLQPGYKAIQGMSTTVGADGGFTILPEFAPGIIDRVYANNLFSKTDNYNVSGNNMTFLANAETSRATGSRHGGLQGYWLAEGGSITASKPTTREVTLRLHKLGVVVYLTDELLSDSGMALTQYITRKASEEFNFMIGDALINGDGIAKPMGIQNCPSLISISKETSQPGATIQIENIEKMYSRFYAPNLGNAEFYVNQDVGPQLDLMTLGIGAAGVPVYMPPGGASVAPYGTIKGRPKTPIEFCATLGTAGDIILADMGQILSISKGGIAQAVSMHIEFLTDQLALRFIMRMNAGPWENAAITPYKGTNTQSSFINLATRS